MTRVTPIGALPRSAARAATAVVAALALSATLLAAPPWQALAAPFVTEDLTGTLTPQDLANSLVGEGISPPTNVTFVGAEVAAGRFSGGSGIIEFDSGVILSSGSIHNVIGPNADDGITTSNGTAGDADLTTLSGQATFDAAVLEFDFVPNADQVTFSYVFASDEYNEFVFSINDIFAFFINGTNCATVDGEPVSVNTINNGNPYGTEPNSHPELFRNNDLDDGGGSINTEMDGLTLELTCTAAVNPGASNHIKLAIADASDNILDSNVFLRAGSFTTNQPPVAQDDAATTTQGVSVTIDVLANDSDPELDPLTVTNLTQPNNGAATLNQDQTVTYTPNAGFIGADSFTYTANDGEFNSGPATVTVTVEGSGPDQAAGFATGDQPTTVQTQPDGLQFSVIVVPTGVTGPVTMIETEGAPCLSVTVTCIGEQLDLTAPSTTADNPLRLTIYVAQDSLPGKAKKKDGVVLHRPDGADVATEIPACNKKPKGVVSPTPACLKEVKKVTINGVAYLRFEILTMENGSWRPGFLR